MVIDSGRPAPSETAPHPHIPDQKTAVPMFPPVVYVPCAPLASGDDQTSVDLRRTRDGRLALLVYSALDRLVDCCGTGQPWTLIPTTDLEQIRQRTGFELILLDLEIPPELRRGHEEP